MNRKDGNPRVISKKECPLCKRLIGSTAFNSHLKTCKGPEEPKIYLENGKTLKWLESMNSRKGKGSNQYIKAKELGLPVPEGPNKGKPSSNKGKPLPEEQRLKMSLVMKNKIAEGSYIPAYKRNHSSRKSRPEKYFEEIFKELPLTYNLPVKRYRLDFANLEKKIYIEIDGEQHFVDPRISKHDLDRTENLKKDGWTQIARIRWSRFEKMSETSKEIFCKNLILKVGNLNHFKDFELVTNFNILPVFKSHTALKTGSNFFCIVLETFERRYFSSLISGTSFSTPIPRANSRRTFAP